MTASAEFVCPEVLVFGVGEPLPIEEVASIVKLTSSRRTEFGKNDEAFRYFARRFDLVMPQPMGEGL